MLSLMRVVLVGGDMEGEKDGHIVACAEDVTY
jgi:hypothetical protein